MIINMDEMNVGQGHEHFSSLGHRNSGARRIDCQYDNKSLLTAEGYALPTLYLKKRKTPRCKETALRDDLGCLLCAQNGRGM